MLTPRQQHFYDLLQKFLAEFGHPPTLAEMKDFLEANGFGKIASLNSVKQYLDALTRAGKIHRDQKKRGIAFHEQAHTIVIPLLPNPVACGAPTNFIEEQAEDHVTVSRRLVSNADRAYAFRASGDSMNRAGIDDGDLVLIEATNAIKDNDIVLASINNCGTLKRLRRGLDTITLLPESTNTAHQPIYLHADDDFLINGKVVNVLKTLTANT